MERQVKSGYIAELIFGKTIIYSTTGFHQGDPLASLLFSLTLHPIVERIQLRVPNLLANEWYLDDGACAGKREELRAVVDIILRHGPARGLILSTSAISQSPKSTGWNPSVQWVQIGEQGSSWRGIPYCGLWCLANS